MAEAESGDPSKVRTGGRQKGRGEMEQQFGKKVFGEDVVM